ncbi:MAG: ribonuclease catalytic domain-containing protein, partial [Desulfovibrionaceae bacterium]|nr:ribonuclease catalytic domain-containing protein [Desulfovibrionaceae bacterium]
MAHCVRYPAPGCIVEYMEGNAAQIALVLEEAAGRLRLLLPNRREVKLSAARLLPWLGPLCATDMNRDEAVRLLETHRVRREDLARDVPVLDVWELAQGEVAQARAQWFAELFVSEPDADTVAGYGRALLACKSHFRFQPPDFQIFSAQEVEKRLDEQKIREEREALTAGGAAFLRLLWDVALKKRVLPPASSPEWPAPEVAARLETVLRSRMIDPESQEHEALWRMLAKGLPDVPHLPLQLLVAWGILPAHYNFWLDRADYAAGDGWWQTCAAEVAELARPSLDGLPLCELPFVSIDSASTRDVDDAFHVEPQGDGFSLTLALACPALCWPFGSVLDRLVLRRGTSIYLPEGDCHMLPEHLGTEAYSLLAGQERPALCVRIAVDGQGRAGNCELFLVRTRLAANLTYQDSQAVLDSPEGTALPDNPAAAHAGALRLGLALARCRQAARIRDGAVVMDRPDPLITLEGSGMDTKVDVRPDDTASDAQMMVAEMMILASASVAEWAREHALPMLHRTQDVAVPREYAGVWTAPQDMARIMRALVPSALEVQARPHAALGLARYTPVTSPLRRYPDLVNEAQIISMLRTGKGRWSESQLTDMLSGLVPVLEATGQVQRFRPRYWKLLFFRQKGDKTWWPGVITEENDNFVSVSLPDQG